MKYIILQTLFGWLTRPILLWNIWDILIVSLEVTLILIWLGNVKSLIKNVKRRVERRKNKNERL